MIKLLKMMQGLIAIEHLDVVTLRRREAAHRPAEMDEVRLDRRVHRVHSNLARQAVGLAGVAWAAGRYDVRPIVAATAGERDQVITRQ